MTPEEFVKCYPGVPLIKDKDRTEIEIEQERKRFDERWAKLYPNDGHSSDLPKIIKVS